MLKVIKRSGREEAFNVEKIKTTLRAASDELHQPLGSGDIDVIAEDVEKGLIGSEKVTTKELYEILINKMKQEGFKELAEAYANNSSNAWS